MANEEILNTLRTAAASDSKDADVARFLLEMATNPEFNKAYKAHVFALTYKPAV